MTDDVAVVNWAGAESPIETGVYGAVNQVWFNQMANADKWAAQAKANDDANREQHAKDVQAWKDAQDDWRTTWAIAQAAYAAAQVLLANNALKAAQDAADKQYDIANRQQDIAESEYQRYLEHFAPCENATIDTECARPEYTEPIEDEANRAAVEIRAQFANSRQQAQRRRNRYCIGSVIALDRTYSIEEARAVGQAKEYTRRYLEEREENRRDKYFNRKIQLFNIGRNIKAESVNEFRTAAQAMGAGADIELAGRNQYYGAILSGIGGLIGAFLPSGNGPQPMRSAASIGGVSSTYNTSVSYAGPGMGPGGLGYGFGAGYGGATGGGFTGNYTGGGMMIDSNMLGPTTTYA
jgi:hypothetical protein